MRKPMQNRPWPDRIRKLLGPNQHMGLYRLKQALNVNEALIVDWLMGRKTPSRKHVKRIETMERGQPRPRASGQFGGYRPGMFGTYRPWYARTEEAPNMLKKKPKVLPRERAMTEVSTLLSRLGIHGLHEIENAVLAGLVTMMPVLLIGAHGSAKTLLIRLLAGALGLVFHAYDAAKSLFEDILGFPVPDSLNKGMVDYARTPLSIFDKEFVLVDELSRANPSMQSKWLEIIWSRRVMGAPIPNLKHVFAAMNPPTTYTGAVALDLALAGRFGFILPMPELRHMDSEDRRRVLRNAGEADAPGEVDLRGFVDSARALLPDIRKAHGPMIEDYVLGVVSALAGQKVFLDGRRAGMMRRNLEAILAVRKAKDPEAPTDLESLRKPFWDALRFSLPFAATGEDVSESIVMNAHSLAFKALTSGAEKEAAEALLRLQATDDPLKAARIYREVADVLASADHEAFLSRLEDGLRQQDSPSKAARHFWALRRIVADYQSGRIAAPVDAVHRALRMHRDTLAAEAICDAPVRAQMVLDRPDDLLAWRFSVCYAGQRKAAPSARWAPYSPARKAPAHPPPDDDRFGMVFTEVKATFEGARQEEEMENVA